MKKHMKIVLLASTLLVVAGSAPAQDRAHVLGTRSAAVPSARVEGPIKPTVTTEATTPIFKNAQYGTGGVALRNRKIGVLNVSGVTGPVQAAYLYWAYLYNTTPRQTQSIGIDQITGESAIVKGTLLGKGADPCWGSDGIAVYRAPVPLNVATGNGSYKITLSAPQSGLTTGEDPWDGNVVFPAAEGASLVIVGTGSYTVQLYDTAIPSATTFSAGLSYSLTLPATASGASTLWDSIGADGQIGASRAASVSGESTSINSVAVSGPGGADLDGDWDGSSGWPLPQLWDDTGHDITAATPGGTTTLGITISASGDCLSTVANVVAVQ